MKQISIPFLNPGVKPQDIRNVVKALKSGWLASGPELKRFEEDFAKYTGLPHVIVNSSATAALHIALMAAGIGPGDEVITTPLTYWATSNVILYVGAKPVFVDVEPDTGLISIAEVKKAITKRTKAIIPIHLYGQMVDMQGLSSLARKHRLVIIEDACHAIEARRDGIRPGEKSYAACYSFHAAKNITAGEGGAVAVHNKKDARIVQMLTDSGTDRSSGTRHMAILGYKYSFTNAQAALLIGQLERIDKSWAKRKSIYNRYVSSLKNVTGISLIQQVPHSKHAYHMFTIIVDPARRDVIRSKLKEAGIYADIHYNPVHLEPYYRRLGYKPGMFPNAERIGFGTITLPLYTRLTPKEQEFTIKTVCTIIGGNK